VELDDWYEGKSPEYVEAVEKFVETFGDDADLENDVESSSSSPDEDPHAMEIARGAVADFICRLHPKDATNFTDDAYAALRAQQEIDQQDDDDKYGHLNEYGEPTDQNNEDD
jgi:hypothetical protein